MTATATRAPSQAAAHQLRVYLQLLRGDQAHGYLEIRYRQQATMSRLFVGTHRLDAAAQAIAELSARTDVYCGAVLRTRHAGGRDAVGPSHLVWVEIDRDDALERLYAFPVPASMVVRSGTGGHAHGYWQLRQLVDVDELEHVNRRLAHHLGADLASTDAARILRPCGTLNHKHTPPRPVTLAAHRPGRRYELEQLLADLSDLPRPTRSGPRGVGGHERASRGDDAALLAIPAATYVRALTGRQVGRDGKVSCPLHDQDRTPSLQTYEDGTFYCFGCQAGGSVYDFAAGLWGTSTKGPAFIELRDRLRAHLLG